MRCKNVDKNLTAFLDGELPNRLRQRVESHLADCANCQAERDALERVRRAVDGMKAPGFVPSVSAEAILERARVEARDPRDSPGKRDRIPGKPFLPAAIGLRPVIALAMGLLVIGLWKVFPILKSLPLPTHQEIHMVERMELFENLELIKELSVVEGLAAEEGHNGELS